MQNKRCNLKWIDMKILLADGGKTWQSLIGTDLPLWKLISRLELAFQKKLEELIKLEMIGRGNLAPLRGDIKDLLLEDESTMCVLKEALEVVEAEAQFGYDRWSRLWLAIF